MIAAGHAIKQRLSLLAMALALPTSLAVAQVPKPELTAKPQPDSNILLAPDSSRQVSLPIDESHAPPAAEDRGQHNSSSDEKPSADAPAARPAPNPTIESLSEQFQAKRESLLKQRELERKVLAEKLLTASGEERDQLIAEFREKQRAWVQEQKSRSAEDFRQRLKSLRDEFKNHERDQLLDEVKGKTRELRERLGKD